MREERPGGPHRRIRSHVIGIVDSILRLSALRRNLSSRIQLPPTEFPSHPLPSSFVAATHARSRGYVVEPPRGHRIIIGWQVTRTLSPGFNWPIIVAQIDGAAGPDRRETFGVACSPSDTTRLSVTNISWQYRVPTYARGSGEGRGDKRGQTREREREREGGTMHGHREEKIEGSRVSMYIYATTARTPVLTHHCTPCTCVSVCRTR